jgi:hypothetical protein
MKTRVIVLCALLAAPLALKGETKPGGYLSFEFIKGQAQSGASQGSFQNLRGGLFFAGDLGEKFDFMFEMGLKSESKLEMEQASVGFKLAVESDLRLGLFLVPFGKYNESNRPHQTALVRAPLNLAGVTPSSWRDIGLVVRGRMGFLRYAAYLGNGLGEKDGAAAGQLFKDNNKDKGKGGRLGFIAGQGFEVGVSYYSGKYDETNALRLTLEGADLTWISNDYEVRGEFTKAVWKNPAGAPDGRSDGYFVLMALNFGKLQPVVSFQRLNRGESSPGARLLVSEEGPETLGLRSRWAFGLRYFMSPTFLVKAEYDMNKEKGYALRNNVVQIQAALSF